MTPGERVRRRRAALGLSQKQLGELAGTNQAHVNNIEHGTRFQTETLVKLAQALHVSADELLGLNGDHTWNDFAAGWHAGYREATRRVLNSLKADPRIR